MTLWLGLLLPVKSRGIKLFEQFECTKKIIESMRRREMDERTCAMSAMRSSRDTPSLVLIELKLAWQSAFYQLFLCSFCQANVNRLALFLIVLS
jgi:hypothetical protein